VINRRLYILVIIGFAVLLFSGCGKDEGDHAPPDVAITDPINNQTVNSIHSIKCTATDNQGVIAVKIIVDGKMQNASSESKTGFKYQWNTTDQEDSSLHVITAQAFDASDNIGLSDTVICIVDNRGIAPVAVVLSEPQNVGKHSMTLNWTRSIDKDFQEYRLYRNSNNSWTGSEVLVLAIQNPGQTVYVDNGLNADSSWVTPWGLDENKNYYYQLQVVDTADFSSNSNVVSALTKLPEPVVLKETYSATKLSAMVSWYKSTEDVNYYRIHRNRLSTVGSSLSDSVGIALGTQSSFIDTGLTSLTSYYYKVFVVDDAGYASGSNVIQIGTGGIGDVTMHVPVGDQVKKHSIELHWSKSKEEDDCEYRLYRSASSGVSSADEHLATVYQKEDTVYTDTGLQDDRPYYYVVYLVDSENNITKSNEISVKTMRLQPSPLSVKSVEKYQATINWERYPDDDFAGYFLYRSDQINFNTSAADIKHIFHNPTVVEYVDENLNLDTQYFYQLFIADTFGTKAGSDISLQTKSIERIEIKEITAIDDSFFRLVYTMNREDKDFQYYSIHRGDNSDVGRTDLQVGTASVRSDTVFDDPVTAVQNSQYYYRVYVVDSRDNSSAGSNVVGDTLNTAPVPVTLTFAGYTTTSIQLCWSLDENDDFSVYELYRSTKSEFTNKSKNVLKVATISNKNTTNYTESNLPSGALYYYCVYVVDIGGKSSASNIVRADTMP